MGFLPIGFGGFSPRGSALRLLANDPPLSLSLPPPPLSLSLLHATLHGRPVAVGGIDGKVIKVAAGSACTFAIWESGKAFAWGFGENLQLTNGVEEDAATPILCQGKQIDDRKILAIDSGGQHSVIVAMD